MITDSDEGRLATAILYKLISSYLLVRNANATFIGSQLTRVVLATREFVLV
jgi:hypothetical protein